MAKKSKIIKVASQFTDEIMDETYYAVQNGKLSYSEAIGILYYLEGAVSEILTQLKRFKP